MSGSEIIFEKTFKKELEPLLLELGFLRYSLQKGWIQPSYLFRHSNNNVWFGCSWDWRDFYFEAELGGLYKFRDVLPRVVICGYSLVKDLRSDYNTSVFITEQFINVRNRIITLTKNNFKEYYYAISDVKREKTQKIKKYLENEILSDEELPFTRL